ncbi:hypothetical protein [Mesorhizobium sp. B1-1-8]|uniref:hypothetical protein n=1 Tax=Mesorhizobium sp. B1-1-8 TaxID=2589976 RepID=UPI00112C9C04|nr:hypothetical protein [Mesorhizobium sp. B1-1-8]UCI05277.1 hypothetical protein FJ974_15570 [Mesorhizobium sp. B1-1-8]
MMSLFLAIHVHAAKRGDGLLPEFLGLAPQPGDVPKAMNENPVASAEQRKSTSRSDPQTRRPVRKPVIL